MDVPLWFSLGLSLPMPIVISLGSLSGMVLESTKKQLNDKSIFFPFYFVCIT